MGLSPAVATIGSALIGGAFSAYGARSSNAAAQEAAALQMAFQKESMQNRYQWTMADMKKAGLNPILAYKQGGGGSLSGASYTPSNVGAAATTGAQTGASSALQLKLGQAAIVKTAQEIEQIKDQRKLLEQQWIGQEPEMMRRAHEAAMMQTPEGYMATKARVLADWAKHLINPLSGFKPRPR